MMQLSSYVTQGEKKVCRLKRLSMISSGVHERGLRNSALPSLALIFTCFT